MPLLTEDEYLSRDALGLAELVKRKEVTAAELLDLAIERMERINPAINAVVTKMYDQARAQASSVRGNETLAGVPFLLKDLRASYKGVNTSSGNEWMSTLPDFDSYVTLHYRSAGLMIMGKTNVPELGLSIDTQNCLFGATRNPWDLNRSAGGSSGGSAAAVAARLVPAAHCSDGAGSTRMPSSNCGVFGLKTSKGRISYGPDSGEEVAGMSTQHACTISVRDSAALLDVTSVPNYGDPYWAPQPKTSYLQATGAPPKTLRVALSFRPANNVPVHPECVEAVRRTAVLCEALGHHVEEAEPNIDWDDGYVEAGTILLGASLAAGVKVKTAATGKVLGPDDFCPALLEFLKVGERASSADYYLAVRKIHSLSRTMAQFHENYDVLLTPSQTTPALLLTEFDYGKGAAAKFLEQFWTVTGFMLLANASGQPAMTVPLDVSKAGLPIGSQFMARFGSEDVLFNLAAQLEQAAPWSKRKPAVA